MTVRGRAGVATPPVGVDDGADGADLPVDEAGCHPGVGLVHHLCPDREAQLYAEAPEGIGRGHARPLVAVLSHHPGHGDAQAVDPLAIVLRRLCPGGKQPQGVVEFPPLIEGEALECAGRQESPVILRDVPLTEPLEHLVELAALALPHGDVELHDRLEFPVHHRRRRVLRGDHRTRSTAHLAGTESGPPRFVRARLSYQYIPAIPAKRAHTPGTKRALRALQRASLTVEKSCIALIRKQKLRRF